MPLARIDGESAIQPHPAARVAFGADPQAGKASAVPTTNPGWSDRFNVAAANDGPEAGSPRPSASPAEGPTGGPAEGPPPNREASATAQIYYFHNQVNGLPEELSDNQGNLVWRAVYQTWGATAGEEWQAFDATGKPLGPPQPHRQPAAQNLRLQGQYLDRETGLHYNTFRYYDADLGAFTSPDPIGLAGG